MTYASHPAGERDAGLLFQGSDRTIGVVRPRHVVEVAAPGLDESLAVQLIDLLERLQAIRHEAGQ